MADNITLGTSGQVLSTDDLGGVQVPRMKMQIGADGSAADIQPPSDALANAATMPAGGMLWNGTNWERSRTPTGDGLASQGIAMLARMLFNGTTFDRERGNQEGNAIASAARTATTTGSTITNYNARGVILALDITVAPGAPAGYISLRCRTLVNGKSMTYHVASAANEQRTTTGTFFLIIYPGSYRANYLAGDAATFFPTNANTGFAAAAIPAPLGRSFSPAVVHTAGDSYTYSVEYCLVV